jgi:hypothetical protein
MCIISPVLASSDIRVVVQEVLHDASVENFTWPSPSTQRLYMMQWSTVRSKIWEQGGTRRQALVVALARTYVLAGRGLQGSSAAGRAPHTPGQVLALTFRWMEVSVCVPPPTGGRWLPTSRSLPIVPCNSLFPPSPPLLSWNIVAARSVLHLFY